jgi:hypothetical protein
MQPEISRRCVSCGAAVRAGARFCPQCGKTVPDAAARVDAAAASPEDPTPTTRDAELSRASAPSTREVYAAASESESSTPTPRAADAQQQSRPEDGAASEERRGRVARVREEARTRVENTRARVERVKGDALVALEETPDDSGLRFVGVAVGLFVLFLLFLLLSVTVLR